MTAKHNRPSGDPSPVSTSIPIENFSLSTFAALTPELVGASRAHVFLQLPSALQQTAMDRDVEAVRERTEQRRREGW